MLSKQSLHNRKQDTFLYYCIFLTIIFKPEYNMTHQGSKVCSSRNHLMSNWILLTFLKPHRGPVRLYELTYLEYPYWSVTTLAPLQERYFLKTWCSWKSSTSEAKSPTNTENSGLTGAKAWVKYSYFLCTDITDRLGFMGNVIIFSCLPKTRQIKECLSYVSEFMCV